MDINTKDIVDIIQKKIDAENTAKFFNVRSYNSKGPTLKSQFPEFYDSAVYRLLIILGLHKEENALA